MTPLRRLLTELLNLLIQLRNAVFEPLDVSFNVIRQDGLVTAFDLLEAVLFSTEELD